MGSWFAGLFTVAAIPKGALLKYSLRSPPCPRMAHAGVGFLLFSAAINAVVCPQVNRDP
jgi:hypothetical protein